MRQISNTNWHTFSILFYFRCSAFGHESNGDAIELFVFTFFHMTKFVFLFFFFFFLYSLFKCSPSVRSDYFASSKNCNKRKMRRGENKKSRAKSELKRSEINWLYQTTHFFDFLHLLPSFDHRHFHVTCFGEPFFFSTGHCRHCH